MLPGLAVELPLGSRLDPAKLKILTLNGEASIGAGIPFQKADPNPQLVALVDSDYRPLLFAFLDPSKADSARLGLRDMAGGLIYFGIGGMLADPDQRAATLARILKSDECAHLSKVLATRLLANPAAIADRDPILVAAIVQDSREFLDRQQPAPAPVGGPRNLKVQEEEGGAAGGPGLNNLLIDPSDGNSGIEVLQDTAKPGCIFIRNHRRRYVYFYIKRTAWAEDKPKAPLVADPAILQDQTKLKCTLGAGGNPFAKAMQMREELEKSEGEILPYYTYRDSKSINLPLKGKETDYEISVVGPGAWDSWFPLNINTPDDVFGREMLVGLGLASLETAVDFFASLLALFFPELGKAAEEAASGADKIMLAAITDEIKAMIKAAPGVSEKLDEGKFLDAARDLYTEFAVEIPQGIARAGWENFEHTCEEKIEDICSKVEETVRGPDGKWYTSDGKLANSVWNEFDNWKALTRTFNILGIFSAVTMSLDKFAQAYDVANSSLGIRWTVKVVKSHLQLSPSDSTIQPGQEVDLATHVGLDHGPEDSFVYHWKTSGNYGYLLSLGDTASHGIEFDTVLPRLTYVSETATAGTLPPPGAQDTVEVQLFDKPNKHNSDGTVTLTPVGEAAQATISIDSCPAGNFDQWQSGCSDLYINTKQRAVYDNAFSPKTEVVVNPGQTIDAIVDVRCLGGADVYCSFSRPNRSMVDGRDTNDNGSFGALYGFAGWPNVPDTEGGGSAVHVPVGQHRVHFEIDGNAPFDCPRGLPNSNAIAGPFVGVAFDDTRGPWTTTRPFTIVPEPAPTPTPEGGIGSSNIPWGSRVDEGI